jgi:hypothetical protein
VPALLLALLLAQDPSILDLRTVTDGYARSGCWLPLRVRVGGPAGFSGSLTASADAGFRVTRPFTMPAGGVADVFIPVVVVGQKATVEVVLHGPSGPIQQRVLQGLKMLDRPRLVLVDPRHPDFDELMRQPLTLPKGPPIVLVASDPADWNEAADVGAMEVADAVVVSEAKRNDLSMTVWQALGGSIVTRPRADLLKRLEDPYAPAARFPSIDPIVARFTVNESWIPLKRESTLLFTVIYFFAFFVAVFLTWSRKSGIKLLMLSALAASGLFVAAYSMFYPRGNLAVRSWQGVVDAPEAPLTISVSVLWGGGYPGQVEFGRILKPVHPTIRDAMSNNLELVLGEGKWTVRGAAPGDATRFVTVERLPALDPYQPPPQDQVRYRPEESEYLLRVPRKNWIRLQRPDSAPVPSIRAEGLVETRAARIFRVEARR